MTRAAEVFCAPAHYAAVMTALNGQSLRPHHLVATAPFKLGCEEAIQGAGRRRGRKRPGQARAASSVHAL